MTRYTTTSRVVRVLITATLASLSGVGQSSSADVVWCSDHQELNRLKSRLSPESAREVLLRRYEAANVPLSSGAEAREALERGVGSSFVDPIFGFDIAYVAEEIKQINGERNHFNSDDSLAFFRTGAEELTVFDGSTGMAVRRLSVSTPKSGGIQLDEVRWHPSDPQLLIYPKGTSLWTMDIQSGSRRELFSFTGDVLGLSGRRLAGGDGNDIDRESGRFLLTRGGSYGAATIYDFYEGQELQITAGASSNTSPGYVEFDFRPNLDYATLVPGGHHIVALYHDEGIELLDLQGRLLGELYEASPHIELIRFHEVGAVKPAIVLKQIGAKAEAYGRSPGDVSAITFEERVAANGARVVETSEHLLLEWPNRHGPASRGQFSAAADGPFVFYVIETPSEDEISKNEGRGPYMGEIVELSALEQDSTPRRIVQHLNALHGSAMRQPEAWSNSDGSRLFFKSNVSDLTSDPDRLFFVDVGQRTCKEARLELASLGSLP